MARYGNDSTHLPQRVEAALQYLRYCDYRTTQTDASIPVPELSPLEVRVHESALRVLQAYFLGEMDYVDSPERHTIDRGPDEDEGQRVPAAP